MPKRSLTVLSAPLLVLATLAAPASSQGFTWVNATELSFVATAGNSSSSTLGLKAALTGAADGSALKFEIGGIRASSEFRSTTAVGTATNYTLDEQVRSEPSAENYFAKGRYDHDVGAAFLFGGGGWDRNTFAGVNHRFGFVAGVGKTWAEGDTGLFKTDIGGTYTIQKDVEDDPTKADGFGGVRATLAATRALTPTADLASTLVLDENLRDTEDLRLDWVVSIAVALSEGLAFKTSYQLLYDNDPALAGIPLFNATGAAIGNVLEPTNSSDSYVTLSLVIKL